MKNITVGNFGAQDLSKKQLQEYFYNYFKDSLKQHPGEDISLYCDSKRTAKIAARVFNTMVCDVTLNIYMMDMQT
jgi:hypothetical protein